MGKWITSGTKPEDGKEVLAVCFDLYDGTRIINIAKWSVRDNEWIDVNDLEPFYSVTHWLPLPELPPVEVQ